MLDTSRLAFPKPGHVGKTKVVKLTKSGYDTQRRRRWEKQAKEFRWNRASYTTKKGVEWAVERGTTYEL